MSVRAYVLLDIVDRSYDYAVQTLRSRVEVVLADQLEGRPNIIAMVEATDRRRLAEAIMPVIECIDGITEDLQLLVTRDDDTPPGLAATDDSRRPERKVGKHNILRGEP